MEKVSSVTSVPTPFFHPNVDTDTILPGEFLKTITRTGLGKHAFHSHRYSADGEPLADNIFDREPYRTSSILVAGENFGCGSSREHAPWALADLGYRCIIAPSFADIFAGNCAKNGIMTVPLPEQDAKAMAREGQEGRTITADLVAQQVVTSDGRRLPFDYNPAFRTMLLNGLDEIGQTLQSMDSITAYEKARKEREPWLFNPREH